jgi:hypothetical protein
MFGLAQLCANAAPSETKGWRFMYPETSKFKKSTFHPENTVQYFSKEKMLRCQYVALLATRFMVSTTDRSCCHEQFLKHP